jgi:uncharacterized protein
MSRLLILGATGSLGRHVLRQAVGDGHDLTVSVRTPAKLPPEVRERVSVHTGDLSALVPLDLVGGQDALINCACGRHASCDFQVRDSNRSSFSRHAEN